MIRPVKRNPIDISLRPHQFDVFSDPHRFKIVVAGRRFGKTWLARTILLDQALKGPKRKIHFVAPTYRQAKELLWVPLKDIVPKSYIQKKDEVDLSLTLRNGSTISLRGADNPDSLRGPGLDYVAFDEVAFQSEYGWQVIRPMLSDREGGALFITSPAGFNWVHDLVMDTLDNPQWKQWQFTTAQGGNVTLEEIEEARATLDPRMFKQEYEASFENLAGRVFYAFDRLLNCIDPIEDDKSLPLHIGMDFNVAPVSAVIGVLKGKQYYIFDEIRIMNGNTSMMAAEIKLRYPNRNICVYPDPTGASRHSNAPVGMTDFSILRDNGFQVLAPAHPYAVADKVNMMNAALCNSSGVRRVHINKRCHELIKAFDGLTYVEGTSQPDKKSGLDHCSDAACYATAFLFPIGTSVRRIATTAGV